MHNICMEMRGEYALATNSTKSILVCSHNITTSSDARAFIDVPSIAREEG